MSNLSDAAELLVLDWLLGTGNPNRPAAHALGITTVAVTDSMTGATVTEPPAANGYSRQDCPFDAAAAGQAQNTAIEEFGPNTNVDWGTIISFFIADSLTFGAGGIVVYGNLTTPRAVAVDDVLQFAANAITVTAD